MSNTYNLKLSPGSEADWLDFDFDTGRLTLNTFESMATLTKGEAVMFGQVLLNWGLSKSDMTPIAEESERK